MDNIKNPEYYIKKIIKEINFILNKCNEVSQIEFEDNELLNNAICFKMIQISEYVQKLPVELKNEIKTIEWFKLVAMRNRIVHDYGNVNLEIVYNVIKLELPNVLNSLDELANLK